MNRHETPALRAAIYTRVSTKDQATEGTSLGTQLQQCRAWVTAQGWQVMGEYVDEGVSGAKESRPALDRLVGAMRRGEIDAVVVGKLDRFGRSLAHLATLLQEMDRRNVRFVSVSEAFDSSSPAGRLQRSMLGAFAEFERERIVERMTAGKAATTRAGRWPGGRPPYGFRIDRSGGHARLAVDEAEQGVLDTIVSLVVDEGLNTGEAASRLNALGLRTRHGKLWNTPRISWLLTVGTPLDGEWGYRPIPARRQLRSEALFVVEVPRLLSEERVAALRARLALSAKGPRKAGSRHYLLTPLASLCGQHYRGKVAHGIPTYRCAAKACGCPTIPAEDAEDAVWAEVVKLLADPARLEVLAQSWLRARRTAARTEEDTLESLDRRIAKLERSLSTRVGEYLREGLPADAVRQAAGEIEREIANLRSHRERLIAYQGSEQGRVGSLEAVAAYARESLINAEPALRARVLGLLRVEVAVADFRCCPVCAGSGKVSGGHTGLRCGTCKGTRRLASFRLSGEVPEALLATGALDDAVGDSVTWPFSAEAAMR